MSRECRNAFVDPCGENGEFHSFVYDGPIFRKRISHRIGEVVVRDNRFCFCDLKPALQDIRMYSERGEDVGTVF